VHAGPFPVKAKLIFQMETDTAIQAPGQLVKVVG
jgi:hypothetical protein